MYQKAQALPVSETYVQKELDDPLWASPQCSAVLQALSDVCRCEVLCRFSGRQQLSQPSHQQYLTF